MSPRQIEILKSEVNKMLELKIIEPGESYFFTSPLILVEAQGKEAKPCIDYRSPDLTKPFIIQCDASNLGIGVVLSQVCENEEHPIMFLCKKLSLAEQKYSTTEKECAAIIFAVQKLKCYLDGHQKFVIQTDHNPLVWLDINGNLRKKTYPNSMVILKDENLPPCKWTMGRILEIVKGSDGKDEVEKLAYQLHEEAERTERPIRRLSKVMYGSTCADMQVDVMGECLSSIKHVVGVTGRPISRFSVARRLHGGGLFARRPVRCVPLTPAHRRRRSLWCREHRNWRDNEWERVLFTDESRFSLSSDFHRILIWRERGSRNHPSNIIERDRYGGRGVLVWGGIMLGSRTDLHIFDAGSFNGTHYCNEILLPNVRLF
ncbi:transposable element Tcb1 transposase [Trichonephila clavipes]|nr:transposable element Tcb1 transposase [Trichonephila clavipes]